MAGADGAVFCRTSSSDASIVTITNVTHLSTIFHHLKLAKTNSPLRGLFLDIAVCFRVAV